jgi:hypothetical protein
VLIVEPIHPHPIVFPDRLPENIYFSTGSRKVRDGKAAALKKPIEDIYGAYCYFSPAKPKFLKDDRAWEK